MSAPVIRITARDHFCFLIAVAFIGSPVWLGLYFGNEAQHQIDLRNQENVAVTK